MNSLICPVCNENITINDKFKKMIAALKQNDDQMWIYCDEHTESTVKFYCEEDECLICEKCILKHNAHLNEVREIGMEEVKELCEKAIAKLNSIKDKI